MTMAEMRSVVHGLVKLHRLRLHPSVLTSHEQNRNEPINCGAGHCHGVPLHAEPSAIGAPLGVNPIAIKKRAATQARCVTSAHRRVDEVQDLHLLDRRLDGGDHRHDVDCAQHVVRCLALQKAALRLLVASPIAHNPANAEKPDFQ